MKINHEYLKGMLQAFEAAKGPTTDIRELKALGYDYEEKAFIFHLRLLHEQGFVKSVKGHGLGINIAADGCTMWSVIPLRLTAQGHEFLEALSNSTVWDIVKTKFKDASIGTLALAAKLALEACTKAVMTG
jgi:repressor of nif and glnA expression